MSPSKFFLIILTLLISSISYASPNLSLDDDAYDILQRLEAEGIIQSSILTTRPLSRKEVVRLTFEAERNSRNKSHFIKSLVSTLKQRVSDEINSKKYIKPVGNAYGDYIYSDSIYSEKVTKYNDGYSYDKGSNTSVGLISRADLGWFSLYMAPEVRYSEEDTDLELKQGYGVLSMWGLDLEAGKDSRWWGPGYHGSLLFSNNAEPLTMVKLSNTHPVILPSVLKPLGLFKFSAFATKLESNRTISEPYLWGLRLTLKVNPYFELGLQRTAMLGGEGRSDDLKTWWNSFTGSGENEAGSGSGDQKAGMDMKVTIPFSVQPLQVYGELAGEDEANGLPSKEAFIAGIYFPRVLALEELSLRIEYADNHTAGDPAKFEQWYLHHVYRSGYTYRGRVIGHHMGSDSRDLFLEAKYYISLVEGATATVSYDNVEHDISGPVKENIHEYAGHVKVPLNEHSELNGRYSFSNIENFNGVSGENEDISIISGGVRYRF